MDPFRELLSSKKEFVWTQELQNAFKIAKKAIVQNIKDGVKTYVPGLVTALISDWSKVGIGYMLTQKKM